MLCIQHQSTDPYFNIATDEYIFKNLQEDCFMLWRNDNAIIVGKHQNTLAEINSEYVEEQGIKIVRRLSGGGAVYHDLGNLNFSFTRTGENTNLVDFKRYTLPIIEVLQSLGVDAKFEGRNDLTIDGKKFSGNAEHVLKNKVLHHGTLLFSSEMKNVSGGLKVNPLKYEDRAIKSVPKRVTNISEHLKEPLSLEEFTSKIMQHILATFSDAKMYEFTPEDLAAIQKLRDEKYATWDWTYGNSPNYNFKQGVKTTGGVLEMNLEVKKGMIEAVKIEGDFFHIKDIEAVEKALLGCAHDKKILDEKLSQIHLEDYFRNISKEDLLAALF
jgi:lipoate-protein ligase A